MAEKTLVELKQDGFGDGAADLLPSGDARAEKVQKSLEGRFAAQKGVRFLLTQRELESLRKKVADAADAESAELEVARDLADRLFFVSDFSRFESDPRPETAKPLLEAMSENPEIAAALAGSFVKILNRAGFRLAAGKDGAAYVSGGDSGKASLMNEILKGYPALSDAFKSALVLNTSAVDAFAAARTDRDGNPRSADALSMASYVDFLRAQYGLKEKFDEGDVHKASAKMPAEDADFLLSYAASRGKKAAAYGSADAIGKNLGVARSVSAQAKEIADSISRDSGALKDAIAAAKSSPAAAPAVAQQVRELSTQDKAAKFVRDPFSGVADIMAKAGPIGALAILGGLIYMAFSKDSRGIFWKSVVGISLAKGLGLTDWAADQVASGEAGKAISAATASATETVTKFVGGFAKKGVPEGSTEKKVTEVGTALASSEALNGTPLSSLVAARKEGKLQDVFAGLGGGLNGQYYSDHKAEADAYVDRLAEGWDGKDVSLTAGARVSQLAQVPAKAEPAAETKPETVDADVLKKNLADARAAYAAAVKEQNDGWDILKDAEKRREASEKTYAALAAVVASAQELLAASAPAGSPDADAAMLELAKSVSGKENGFGSRDYATATMFAYDVLDRSGKVKLPGKSSVSEYEVVASMSPKEKNTVATLLRNGASGLSEARKSNPLVAAAYSAAEARAWREFEAELKKSLANVDEKTETALTSEQKAALALLRDIQGAGWTNIKDTKADFAWDAAKMGVGFAAGGLGALGGKALLRGSWAASRYAVIGAEAVGGGTAMTTGNMLMGGQYWGEALKYDLGPNVASFALFAFIGQKASHFRAAENATQLRRFSVTVAEAASTAGIGYGQEALRSCLLGYRLDHKDAAVNAIAWALMPIGMACVAGKFKGKPIRETLVEYGVGPRRAAASENAAASLSKAEKLVEKSNTQEAVGDKPGAAATKQEADAVIAAAVKDAEAARAAEPTPSVASAPAPTPAASAAPAKPAPTPAPAVEPAPAVAPAPAPTPAASAAPNAEFFASHVAYEAKNAVRAGKAFECSAPGGKAISIKRSSVKGEVEISTTGAGGEKASRIVKEKNLQEELVSEMGDSSLQESYAKTRFLSEGAKGYLKNRDFEGIEGYDGIKFRSEIGTDGKVTWKEIDANGRAKALSGDRLNAVHEAIVKAKSAEILAKTRSKFSMMLQDPDSKLGKLLKKKFYEDPRNRNRDFRKAIVEDFGKVMDGEGSAAFKGLKDFLKYSLGGDVNEMKWGNALATTLVLGIPFFGSGNDDPYYLDKFSDYFIMTALGPAWGIPSTLVRQYLDGKLPY